MVDPGTAMIIGPMLAGLMGGGGGQPMSDLHLVNPQQQALYQQMFAGLRGGGGDFGFGTNVRQGGSQLAQMMAQRGISPQSGAAAGAYGSMVGTAASADQEARRNYMLQLLGVPLQVASATGKNFIPGSPSYEPFKGPNNFSTQRGPNSAYGGSESGSLRGQPSNRWGMGA